MNDTPETEAAVIASGGDWSPVLRETCRRLERERNEALSERDEARELLNEYRNRHDLLPIKWDI